MTGHLFNSVTKDEFLLSDTTKNSSSKSSIVFFKFDVTFILIVFLQEVYTLLQAHHPWREFSTLRPEVSTKKMGSGLSNQRFGCIIKLFDINVQLC